jgi:BirA family transcriptional regulator, biotin operon repressor / biotin---[acetyl-CoA-carboxylase] ligase
MLLPLSAAIAPNLHVVPEIGSTNTELAARAAEAAAAGRPLADFTVLMTTSQTAGKGRLGRSWVAPPGTTIAVSVLLRPPAAGLTRIGWIPLLAGLAMTRVVRSLLATRESVVESSALTVALKWPNDVHIAGLKVAGLLGEVLPHGAVVIGAGLNLTMSADELPVPTATSLTLCGAAADGIVDRALAAYLGELRAVLAEFERSGFDPGAGLRASVIAACGTIGRDVRVDLPGEESLYGVAVDIDADGRLIVRQRSNGRTEAVAAGDVTHLRYE